jgi:hypothetical protein
MNFTLAQLQTIKADILASPDLNGFPDNGDGEFEIARLYNLEAVPAFVVWRTDAPIDGILDAIDLTKYTPIDVPSTADLPATSAAWLNRSQNILVKQGNLILLTQGRDTLNTAKVSIRNGLKDAVTGVPAGAGGAGTAPGGASGSTVLTACLRNAKRIEKLLATASQGSDQTGTVTARVMGFEGSISPQDIHNAKVS